MTRFVTFKPLLPFLGKATWHSFTKTFISPAAQANSINVHRTCLLAFPRKNFKSGFSGPLLKTACFHSCHFLCSEGVCNIPNASPHLFSFSSLAGTLLAVPNAGRSFGAASSAAVLTHFLGPASISVGNSLEGGCVGVTAPLRCLEVKGAQRYQRKRSSCSHLQGSHKSLWRCQHQGHQWRALRSELPADLRKSLFSLFQPICVCIFAHRAKNTFWNPN